MLFRPRFFAFPILALFYFHHNNNEMIRERKEKVLFALLGCGVVVVVDTKMLQPVVG